MSIFLQTEKERFFKKIVQTYSKELGIYAYYFLRDEEEARDTVQEVFIRLWEKPSFRIPDPEVFKRFLYIAVRNACLDKIEKQQVRQRHIDRLSLELLYEEHCTFDEELIREIKAEIERLPSRTRHIIYAIFVRNLKYQETADELGISINTVKSLLKSGLKRLRDNFSGKMELYLLALIIRKHTDNPEQNK